MNREVARSVRCYTEAMETVVLVIVALVVAIVAIDAIAKLDERRAVKRAQDTEKIIVDLSRRR